MLMFCTSSTKSIIAVFGEKSSAFLSFFQIFQIVRSYPISRVFSTCFPVKTLQCDPTLKVFRTAKNFNEFFFPCFLHPRADSGLAPVRGVRRRAHLYKNGRPFSRSAVYKTLLCRIPVSRRLRQLSLCKLRQSGKSSRIINSHISQNLSVQDDISLL